MKTKVIMERALMGGVIRQDSKTMMFNANDMHEVGNAHRIAEGLPPKQLASYFNTDSTAELLAGVCIEEGLELDGVKVSRRGRDGGTWVHPIVFVDLAMWYSPTIKIKVIKWVLDGLIAARGESGDSFRDMNRELTERFPNEFTSAITYARIANRIADACGVPRTPNRWQNATEEQLKMRDKIQNSIVLIAGIAPNAGSAIAHAIKTATKQR